MRITYHIKDGYVGGSRPHYIEIPDDELRQMGEDDSVEEYIDEMVREHFQQNISPYWDRKQINHLQ